VGTFPAALSASCDAKFIFYLYLKLTATLFAYRYNKMVIEARVDSAT